MKAETAKGYAGVLLLLFIAALSFSGCATLVHGTTQKIPVNSEPPGAECSMAGNITRYTTPCEVELSRKQDHLITIKKDGYHPETVEVKKVLSGAVAGNILGGGLIGWGVDASNGAQNRLVPETINVTLKSEKASQPGSDPANRSKKLEDELKELNRLLKEGKISDEEFKKLKEKCLTTY
jgi:hypothetical protein